MTMLFEGSPKFSGISGDHARVAGIEGLRAMIRVNAIRYLNMSHEDIDAAIRAALSSTGEKV